MPYQIFTRTSHRNGVPTPGSRPRRVKIVPTIDEARKFCTAKNAKRSRRAIIDGFHYEFADSAWYTEAFL